MIRLNTAWSLVGGVLGAVGASACCLGPLVLVTLGLGGAWIASARALQPLFPAFVLITIGFFGAAYWKLYVEPTKCAAGTACDARPVKRWQRILFLVLAVKATALITFPWYGPWLFA